MHPDSIEAFAKARLEALERQYRLDAQPYIEILSEHASMSAPEPLFIERGRTSVHLLRNSDIQRG